MRAAVKRSHRFDYCSRNVIKTHNPDRPARLSAVVLPLVVYADGINGTAGGPVGLWANAVEALHIDSSQHVGIGTTTVLSQLLTVWGNIDSGNAGGFLTEIANAGTTGTTVNKLAKLNTSGTAVIAATTDTDGMIGVVVGSAGTSGNAQIAIHGQAACVFDGATTAGDFVTISSTTAGDCHDAGSARPAGSQSIGRVLSTNGSGGSYVVSLGLGGTSAGNIPVGTISAFASTTCPTGWTVYSPAVGRFLRGIDTAANTSDTQNRTPGTTETDMMQGHKHSVTTNGSIASVMVPDGLSSYGSASSNWSVGSVVIGSPTGDGTNGTPRTGLGNPPRKRRRYLLSICRNGDCIERRNRRRHNQLCRALDQRHNHRHRIALRQWLQCRHRDNQSQHRRGV